jgi:hypothetical protein
MTLTRLVFYHLFLENLQYFVDGVVVTCLLASEIIPFTNTTHDLCEWANSLALRLLTICQIVKHDSSLQRTRFHCTSPMAVSFTPLQPTLGIVHDDLRLVCGCSAMETHVMKLPT